MDYAETGSRGSRARAVLIVLCVGMTAIACAHTKTRPILPFSSSVAKQCERWTMINFKDPSPARDEGFITCIAKRDLSVSRQDLLDRLATGGGVGLYDRLVTGRSRPLESKSDCAYMRMAVQSPAGSSDSEQEPMRELFSRALVRAGFEVVPIEMEHRWWASSLALEMGSNTLAWTIVVRAVPEIGNGEIQFTTVDKTVDGRVSSFSGMQSLHSFDKNEASEAAWLAASAIAEELLPAANRRCDDVYAALEEAQMRLEQLRNELTKEIERVRSEKSQRRSEEARRRKQLLIEVEG